MVRVFIDKKAASIDAPVRRSAAARALHSQPQPERHAGPVRVAYIMGTGRSGSTVLGVALGNVNSAFYAGELCAWNLFHGTPRTENASTCAFWADVMDRMPKAACSFAVNTHQRFDHHSSLFCISAYTNRQQRAMYEHQTTTLYQTVAAASACRVIIESSHYPIRFMRLRRNRALDVSVIWLVRDPRAVVASLRKNVQRRVPMSIWTANLYCLVVFALAAIAYWSTPRKRRIFVRYEDFIANPHTVMDRLCAFLNLHNTIDSFSNLRTGFAFQCNRAGKAPTLSIRQEHAQPQASRLARWMTNIIQSPVLLALSVRRLFFAR